MTIDDARRALIDQRLRRNAAPRTIPPRPAGTTPPLSYAQERLWFMDQYAPASHAYVIPVARRIRRHVEPSRLAAAISAVVARHEALRTRYPASSDGVPSLVIDDAPAIELPLIHAGDETTARQAVEALCGKGFDLAVDRPIRSALIRIADDDHVLALAVHHIACDGWSVRILLRDIMATYDASQLPTLPLQYGDYALWQREQPETDLEYWRAQLDGVEPLAMPLDRPRPAEATYDGASVDFKIGEDLASRLRRISESHGASLYMTLLAAYASLLGRYTRQETVTIGTPIAGRPAPELEDIVGCFVNTLVMRADLTGDPSFTELLLRVRETALDAFAHQNLPFERLVSALNVTRDVSRSPLFQTLLAVQNYGTGTTDGLEGFDLPPHTTRFDLELYVSDDGDALWGQVIYNTSLFDATTISRLVDHYVELLEAAVSSPQGALSALDIRDESERASQSAWNDTATPFDEHTTLPALVARQAAAAPHARAVTFEGTTMTYAELEARASLIAAALCARGARPGSRVGVRATRCLDLPATLLGILKTGSAYVPLDPEYPAERLAFMADDADVLTVIEPGETYDEPYGVWIDDGPTAEDTAYVIYTSGSTGRPKGVPNSHRGIVNRLTWMQDRFGLTSADVVLQKTPAGFDVSVWEFFWPLMVGARLVLVRPAGHKDAEHLRDLIVAEGVTTVHFVPSMLAAFLAEDLSGCASLRHIVCSGEELPVDVARRCLRTLPAQLHNLYGPTEAAVDVSAWHCDDASLSELARVPIGAPVANTTLHVLDAHLRPQAVGVPGELHIGGVQVAQGYLGRPRLSAERFIPDPFGPPGARLYKTGDLARWRPDGTIDFLGRIDNQIKLRGVRIELGEIETVLREQPGVSDAAVVVREDRPGDKRLVGYVVGAIPQRAELKRVLPDYMVPSAMVRLDELPLTPNGKLDRRALPAPARDTSPSSAMPSTRAEVAIAAMWTEVLGMERVGVDDDFFDLGGHSLLATQLVAKMRATFGAGISVLEVFKHPTVRELAQLASTRPQGPRALVHELTPRRAKADVTLVCVPFGGGSAVVYQPLADSLPRTHSLWAVAIPGHDVGLDEPRLSFAELIDRCVAEIVEKIDGPVALYGHCGVGSAVAVAIARGLEAAGRRLETIYIGAMFPFARPRSRVARALSALGRMEGIRGDRAYENWLTSIGSDLGRLEVTEAKRIIHNMRQDSREAEQYFTEHFEEGATRLRAPVVSIVGARDPATDMYEERFREWHFITDTSAVIVLDEAGHFFLKHRATEIAEIVTAPVVSAVQIGGETWRRQGISYGDTPMSGPAPSMRRFAAVSTGQLVSMLGSALTEFAIPLWIYMTTGSIEQFGLFAVLGLVPGLLALPLAGAVVDRHSRRLIVLCGDLCAGSVQAILATLVWTGRLSVWDLYPATVALSVALAFQRLAYTSAIPQLVPKRMLGHATGIGQLGSGLAGLLAPLLGAGLLAAIGLRGILTIDVASYFVAVATVAVVRFPALMAWRRRETLRAEIVGGFRYTWGNPNFRRMLVFFAALNVPLSALFLMISPLVLSFATLHEVGEVSFASAVGVFAGGLTMTAWGGPRRRRMFGVLMCTLTMAAFALLTGIRQNLVTITSGAVGMAFGLTLLNGVYTTIIQVKVPQRMHGRVFALNTLIAWSTLPIGFGLIAPYGSNLFRHLLRPGGPLASSFGIVLGTGDGRGIGLMFVLFGLVIAGIALLGLRTLRRFDSDMPDAVADDLVGLKSLRELDAHNLTAVSVASLASESGGPHEYQPIDSIGERP